MPHVIAEYSANLEDRLDVAGLIADLHQVVAASGVADVPAIRTRAARREHFRVGDGNAANGFVHITMRLRVGRPQDTLNALGQALLDAADKRLQNVYATHPVALTVEMHEIDQLTFRRNTLRAASV
jgi:5-carboxymethyl-2-hydroxymuconate isomerase